MVTFNLKLPTQYFPLIFEEPFFFFFAKGSRKFDMKCRSNLEFEIYKAMGQKSLRGPDHEYMSMSVEADL